MASLTPRVERLNDCTFRISGKLILYIDLKEPAKDWPKADILFITRGDTASFAESDMRKFAGPETVVAGPYQCVSRFRLNQIPLKPGDRKEILGVGVDVMNGGHEALRFLLRVEGKRIAHLGWCDDGDGPSVEADICLKPGALSPGENT